MVSRSINTILGKAAVAGGFMLYGIPMLAQLEVGPGTDLTQLAASLAGPGVQIANPSIECHGQGYGSFSYTGSVLTVQQGVLLTTGSAANALGPNAVENSSFEQFTAGSPLLTTMTGRVTHDACRLEFDVIPAGDSIRMAFAFASEEYSEWVGSQYNDVFGIFISGPGIPGDPGLGGEQNLALVPGSATPVMINTVNGGSEPAFFTDNTGGSQIQYDGLTRGLHATAAVLPCATYRMKFIIADVSDRLYDSGLFLAPIKSNAVTMEAMTESGLPYLVEGCNDGIVRFTRTEVTSAPLTVTYYITGTATNGTDYSLVGGNADPMSAKTAVIPANQASVDIPFNTFSDGSNEGMEQIAIHLGSSTCPGVHLGTITIDLHDELVTSISGPVTICSGASTPLSASGGTTYTWSPSTGLSATNIANPTASPTSTTTYSVTITNGDCSRVLTTTVAVSNMTLSAVVAKPLCQGGTNGAINLTVAGGTAPYAYSWTGPSSFTANTQDLVSIGAGTYTVTVTDASGCSRIQSFNVSAPEGLSLTLQPTILTYGQNIACNGGSTGSVNALINGGVAPYVIAWTGPNGFTSNAQNITGLAAGSYLATVTDVNGCSINGSITLSQPPALAINITNLVHVSCFGGNNGMAQAVATGGIPPYSYSWNTSPTTSSAMATGLMAGTYSVTVTDGYGCTAFTTVTILQPTALSVSLTATSNVVHCQGQSQQQGSATAVGSGGTPPYSYAWNSVPPQFTQTALFASGGNYTVTISDALGCTSTTSMAVAQPGSPATSIPAQTNVSCFGANTGSATIAISGGSNIQSLVWNTTPPQTGFTVNGLPPGTYTATAQHADGCQTQVSVTITGPTGALNPVFGSGSVQHVSCSGGNDGSATVSVSGGGAPYSYSWNTTPVQTTATATGLSAGTYSVQITDAFGCTAVRTVAINQPSPLTASITGFTNVLCFGTGQGTASAQASGGTAPYVYSWNSVPPQSGALATDLPAGPYVVTATDANGCTSTASVTIGGPQFSISGYVEDIGNETCFGATDGHATVVVSGGSNSFTITWNTTPPQSGATATGLAPGNYFAEVVDNNGCDTPKQIPVTIVGPPSLLEIDLDIGPASCSASTDGFVDLTISGGVGPYTHTWSDDEGNSTGIEDVTGLSPGTYSLSVHDSYGCVIDTVITVPATGLLGITAVVDLVPCQGMSNGALLATVTDGLAPYTITWTGPNGYSGSGPGVDGLQEGSYTVEVIDANGCEASTSIALTGTAPPMLDLTSSTYTGGWNISCAGATNGAVDLTINGGTAPFSTSWTDGLGFNSSSEDISNVGAGVYQVTVVDAHGCITTALSNLNAPAPVVISAVVSAQNGYAISCSGGIDGSIDLTVTGGTSPYTTAWDHGATTLDLSMLGAGTYAVTLTDANSCTSSASYTLTAPAALDIDLLVAAQPGGTGVSCSGANDGSMTTAVAGGVPAYTYAWNGPNGFSSTSTAISGLAAGTYQLTVTDANGCQASAGSEITEPSPITVSLSSTTYNGGYNIACAGNATGSAQASINGGTPGYTTAWTGPNGFSAATTSISGVVAGSYQVVVTDLFGCTGTAEVVLSEPTPLDVITVPAEIGFGYHVGCAGNDGSIAVTVTGGTPQYAFGWTGPNGFGSMDEDLSSLVPGSYHLTVTDANGCSFDTNAELAQATELITIATVTPSPCHGDGNAAIDLTIDGGVAPYAIEWEGPGGPMGSTEDLSALTAGSYSAIITDAMGCTGSFMGVVTEPAPLTSGAYLSFYGQYNVQCPGDSSGVIELFPQGGTGPYDLAIGNSSGTLTTGQVLNGLFAGAYDITIIDANGCMLDTTVVLSEPSIPVTTALSLSTYPSGTNVSCYGASDGWIETTITSGEGPFTFIWRGPDSLEFNTPNIYDLPAGAYDYELMVIDANQCSYLTTVTLTQPDTLLTASSTVSAYLGGYQVSCHDATDGWIDLDVNGGNGGYTVTWTGPGGTVHYGADLSGVPGGAYTATITDMNGCELVVPVTLAAPGAIVNTFDLSEYPGGTAISCTGVDDGSVSVTTNGGTPTFTHQWSGPGGLTGTGLQLSDLAAGTYCLVVTDANGCSSTECVTLDEPLPLVASTVAQDLACGISNGSIDLTAIGGSAPYAYGWSTGATTEDLSGLDQGSYVVTITDVNGCMTTATASIAGSPGVSISAIDDHILCHGGQNGAIDLSIIAGTGPYTIVWSNGATSEDLQGIDAGPYSVVVTDSNGCTTTGSWTITENTPIGLVAYLGQYVNGYHVSAWNALDGSAEVMVSGGSAPYTFEWSNGMSTPQIVGIGAGTYEVIVTDVNGCAATLSITLEQPNDLAMPTGFSPNGDGANDQFLIRGLDAYPANTFVVFNRWGNVVYDRLNYRNDWSGENTEGQALPDGTYFVILTIDEGARTLQGYVDLRR